MAVEISLDLDSDAKVACCCLLGYFFFRSEKVAQIDLEPRLRLCLVLDFLCV